MQPRHFLFYFGVMLVYFVLGVFFFVIGCTASPFCECQQQSSGMVKDGNCSKIVVWFGLVSQFQRGTLSGFKQSISIKAV